MFISGKRMEAVENRLADLEKKVQGQPTEIASALLGYGGEQMPKSDPTRHQGSGETDIATSVCAAQHIKAFFRQCANGEAANWGEPCAGCRFVKNCSLEWLPGLEPIFDKAGIDIQLCKGSHQGRG